MNNIFEVFWIFLRLGCTSFGGPIAHLGYFHNEFVNKRKWINEHAYADLVALCQFLPGPASSQVGIAIGLNRAGKIGAIAAWLGFTLPSVILLLLFVMGLATFPQYINSGWLHGLKVVAVAVVAQAIWGMSTKLCPDKFRASIAIAAAMGALIFASAIGQVAIIFLGGIVGCIFLRTSENLPHIPFTSSSNKTGGLIFISIFLILLFSTPIISGFMGQHALKQFDSFYRTGSLVFGGGHVVLPLLKNEVVNAGWVPNELFIAGYGAAQALPGPLFAFSAYLGAVSNIFPSGIPGAIICLVAVFLPSFLLIFGVLPFWEHLRKFNNMKFAIHGINASVVGLLIAAFYNPVWTSAILNPKDFGLSIAAFTLLVFWKTPSWLVVLICALAGGLFL